MTKHDESVLIVLPLPHRCLSPNREPITRGGKFQKAREKKKQKRLACQAAIDAGIETGPWGMATVGAVFYHAQNRRRDPDNFMAMLKSAYDGLVEAGLLVDDDWKHLKREEPQFEIDKLSPRVELTVTRRK